MSVADKDLRADPVSFSHDYYCGEGVKNDYQKVVDKFLSSGSVRYEDFLKIWQDMHFVHIFRGRQTELKLREFAQECLKLACELWLESSDFQIQVCGLYLLYGVYFSQPISPKTKVRITLPMWQGSEEFLKSVKKFGHLDVEYVYMKLLLHKAFYFVATVSNVNELVTEDYRRLRLVADNKKHVEKEQTTSIQELLEPDNFMKLEVIDQQYEQMKVNVSGLGSSQPDPSLRVTNKDCLSQVKQDAYTFRQRRLGVVPSPETETETKTDPPSTESSVRKHLKEKALTSKAPPRGQQKAKVKHLKEKVTVSADDAANRALGVSPRPFLCGAGESTNEEGFISMPTLQDLSASDDEDDTHSKYSADDKDTTNVPELSHLSRSRSKRTRRKPLEKPLLVKNGHKNMKREIRVKGVKSPARTCEMQAETLEQNNLPKTDKTGDVKTKSKKLGSKPKPRLSARS